MSRERERIAKKIEKNPIIECNKIQKKFYPELFARFEKAKDPRNQAYINYSCKEMLGTLYFKGIARISSMQRMTREFNSDTVVSKLYTFMGSKEKDYLPHEVTENEFLERLESQEIEDIQKDMTYQMIRRKSFDGARLLKNG